MAVGIKDVAQRAGVSVATVSNVLNGLQRASPAVAQRVLDAADDLGYVRNEAARQLRMGTSSSIGFVVLDVRNPFYTDIVRGAEDSAADLGLTMTIGNSRDTPSRESSHLATFEEQRVRGILITPIGDIEKQLQKIQRRGTPIVLVDRESRSPQFSSVAVDDVAGGRLAAAHLIDIGRSRLAFVGGRFAFQQVIDRRLGVQQALADAPSQVTLEEIEVSGLSVPEGRRIGMEILERAPEDRPDGIFAASDQVAIGLLQALAMGGRTLVPEQIALIGYDDIEFASNAIVPLSSVRQPTYEMGRTAMELLEDAVATPARPTRQVVFQPELVRRSSTG